MNLETLTVSHDDGILWVALNRPDQLNAFDYTMTAELTELWRRMADDADLRVVIITGTGRAFCTGADLGDLAGPRRPRGEGVDGELSFLPGPHLEVPVIVAVNGVCAGGGLHFIADADIAIAGESASFLDPHVSVGQVSALEPISLAARVPLPVLLRLALLGRSERLGAQAALAAGLVTEVVPDGDLRERARALATAIVANSPAAVARTRQVIRDFEQALVHDAMEDGWVRVQSHWSHPDATEGPVAFGERRPPLWGPR
jgi:enoyl-CoA hydratase/carnithine racemase